MKYKLLFFLGAIILVTAFSGQMAAMANDKAVKKSHETELKPYVEDVERRILRCFFPGIPSISDSSQAVVSFTILNDGKCADVKVTEASSDADMNTCAMKAVQNASPFRPKPTSLSDKDRFEAHFTKKGATVKIVHK